MMGKGTLDHKIPPPLVAVFFGVCIYFSRDWSPRFSHDLLFYAGLGCQLLGAAITIASVFTFIKSETTISPLKPHEASSLVTRGMFAFSRNPMYLGMSLFLTGFALQVNVVGGIPLALLFALYLNAFQILPEERALLEKFGEEYREYSRRVRRWI